jgi:phosphoribosylaminoimidazole-succinocarboxamide synthase
MTTAGRLHAQGKVRDVYDAGDERLLLIATDRISAFDLVLPNPIPDKGRVLTGLTLFWLERTADLVPNHLLSADRRDFPEPFRSEPSLAGRAMLCRRAEPVLVECVARGYLTGSGLKQYLAEGHVCGVRLPPGLGEASRLPEPIFTPTTKAAEGHDQPLTPEQAANLVGEERFAELEKVSIDLYRMAAAYADEKGIIIADTKFELGLDEQGKLVLGDEAFTPDSSRFWPADEYAPGGPQPSFDKQFVRDYAESLGWDKAPPGPELPDGVVTGTRARYLEAFEQITGIPFDEYAAKPDVVLA